MRYNRVLFNYLNCRRTEKDLYLLFMRKDFALCFNDGYVPYAAVTIRSIADHMPQRDETHIHVVSDYVSEKHQRFLCRVAGSARVEFHFIPEDDATLEGVPVKEWGIYTWFRLFLPRYLPEVGRVLYLDCDVLVNDALDELFTMDMRGQSVAACLDTQAYDLRHYARLGYDAGLRYVCAGVLLMDLARWRSGSLPERMVAYARAHRDRIEWPDQDAINYVCREDKIILPPRYGVLVPFFRHAAFIREHLSQMDGLMEAPAIIHYAGYQPWLYFKDKSMHSRLWWHTFWRLHAFPKVPVVYALHFVWYWAKVAGLALRIIRPGSRWDVSRWYYDHPRVKRRDVLRLTVSLRSEKN